MRPSHLRRVALLCVLTVLAGACRERLYASGPRRATAVDGFATGVSASESRFVQNIVGFRDPESVRHDPDQDVFFVSNMAGFGSSKDDNGYIVRLSAADLRQATVFVQGGRDGATLHAPKWLAIHGDTLWVADIDVLPAFGSRRHPPLEHWLGPAVDATGGMN